MGGFVFPNEGDPGIKSKAGHMQQVLVQTQVLLGLIMTPRSEKFWGKIGWAGLSFMTKTGQRPLTHTAENSFFLSWAGLFFTSS